MAKRLFDIIFSSLALLLLMPLFLVLALWIKIDSSGPVFFRQKRVGRNGKIFNIFKFRTMHMQQPGGLQLTVSNDSRITSAGVFLRKYKLDELPQFINVLFGDMSIVGPRPEVQKYVNFYPEDAKEKIFTVRPGITDKASLEFINENDLLDSSTDPEKTYIEKILPVKISYYLDYVEKRTFSGDIVLIFKTLLSVFR